MMEAMPYMNNPKNSTCYNVQVTFDDGFCNVMRLHNNILSMAAERHWIASTQTIHSCTGKSASYFSAMEMLQVDKAVDHFVNRTLLHTTI